jgi:hypothetical protein
MVPTLVRYGYRKIRALLNREGWAVGKKLLYRFYREEGLMLHHRVPRRRKSTVLRWTRPKPEKPNEAWTLDVATLLGVGELAVGCFTAYVSYRYFAYGESLSEAIENAIKFESGKLRKKDLDRPLPDKI